jgi:succinyl-diaminopimelate desuccinylase
VPAPSVAQTPVAHPQFATDPLAILEALIALPSVNPMGRDVSGPEYLEGRVTAFLQQFFRDLGVPSETIEVQPGRCNVLARFDRPGATSTILLDAHQDTVPVEGMTIAPFTPLRDGDRLYGRGSCDVKGGMASMLAAFARLVREQPATRANILMSCTCDEEQTAGGARHLARLWSDPKSLPPGSLVTRPDICIVAEPTELDIVVAHRGAVRWKIRTKGVACHSSRPSEGVNAIYRMAQVVRELEHYASELPSMIPPHPLCGPATLSVGRIEGGISVNTVPDECHIEIDRRCVPGEDPKLVIPKVEQYLRERLDVDFEMLPPWVEGATLSDDNNGDWAGRLMQHIEAVAGPREKVGVPYGTNASRFAMTGVPALVFGPGSIEQAHTKDEWIDVRQLPLATEILYRFCAGEGA